MSQSSRTVLLTIGRFLGRVLHVAGRLLIVANGRNPSFLDPMPQKRPPDYRP